MAAGIHQMGVVALRQAYAAGRVSVVAAVSHYLDRISRFDRQLGAFTFVDAEGSRAAAQASAARWEAGTARALEGVPIAIKANIDVAGMPVTGGIGAFASRIADRDAAVITRLRDAGAIILGLTNMHEAALGATTDNVFFGRTHNPYRIGHTAGRRIRRDVRAILRRALRRGQGEIGHRRVVDDGEALIKLRSLQPKKYKYVDQVTHGDTEVFGFIAQEVREILPEAVALGKDVVPDVYSLVTPDMVNRLRRELV